MYSPSTWHFNTDIIVCQRQAKAEVVPLKCEHQSTSASALKSALSVDLQRILSYAAETGASSWLTALPVEEHGFALHKGAFRDAICLRYGWHPSGLPSICACSKTFTVEHAMNCPTGGSLQSGIMIFVTYCFTLVRGMS